MKASVIQSLMVLNSEIISSIHWSIDFCVNEARHIKFTHPQEKEDITYWYNQAEKHRQALKKAVANQVALKAEIKAQKKPKISKKHGKLEAA